MKICKYPTETLFQLKFSPSKPPLCPDYHLVCDDFFDLAVGYAENNKLIKSVYYPLAIYPNLKDNLSLIEMIEKKDAFLLRVRRKQQISGDYQKRENLGAFLLQHQAYYTTFSLESPYLFYPFENYINSPFSLLHYLYEAYPVNEKIRSIAIIADPGNNLPCAYKEGVALFQFLRNLCPTLPLTLITHPLSCENLDLILANNSIVHFAGHIESQGLFLGQEFYHPCRSLGQLPSLLFLNTCQLPVSLLEHFLVRKPRSLIFSKIKVEDSLKEQEKIHYFYLGLLLGYRIGDVAGKCLDFSRYRLYGWLTNRLYC